MFIFEPTRLTDLDDLPIKNVHHDVLIHGNPKFHNQTFSGHLRFVSALYVHEFGTVEFLSLIHSSTDGADLSIRLPCTPTKSTPTRCVSFRKLETQVSATFGVRDLPA